VCLPQAPVVVDARESFVAAADDDDDCEDDEAGTGTCFGSGPELGFEPSQKPAVGTTVVTPKLVPPNANAEGSALKGSEDEDSKKRAYMVNASEDEDKELNG
jgi:hypothetical protein